jgi:hypothetical protein
LIAHHPIAGDPLSEMMHGFGADKRASTEARQTSARKSRHPRHNLADADPGALSIRPGKTARGLEVVSPIDRSARHKLALKQCVVRSRSTPHARAKAGKRPIGAASLGPTK